MSIRNPLLFASSFTLLLACAHTTPPELIDARTAYERAANGPSAKFTPAELHVAKTSLGLAEQSFEDKDDEFLVRDRSYIAQRTAELAESMARTAMYEQGIAFDDEAEGRMKDKDAVRTKAELANAKDALANEQAASAATGKELAAEKQLRAEAEARAEKAAADLARIASVKQDDRGTVITLSGSVLFASNKSELLGGAQAKLSQVAIALLAGDPAATFVVEGHTDSQGKSETNQTLSAERANAVRDYLVQHDIAADRITAVGHGEDRTVAENTSAEGRANNRRVEIVVKAGKSQ
jgi:outer membrane protein OmpA-like peptidoglycan-associated protein